MNRSSRSFALRLALASGALALPLGARAQQHDGHTHEHRTGEAAAERPASRDTTRWTRADVEAFLRASSPAPAPAAHDHDNGAAAPAPEPHADGHAHDAAAPAGEAAGEAAGEDHAGMHGDAMAGHAAEGHAAVPGDAPAMSSATSPDEPMGRDGSGTAWLPEATPMEASHTTAAGWHLMLHGAAFARFTAQDAFGDGTRGDRSFGLPNWVMGMAQRRLGTGGVLTAKAMLSLDPVTEGGNGYPLLFQSGETFEGERLVDRQHPHDLFSELSLTYAHRVAPGASVYGYAGYPGEPALGPVAFMHRPSARYTADSPLAHHWHDATHIAFGVATLGAAVGDFKLDASLFTGAEPDEERFGFDTPTFDSYAARLAYSPSPRLAFQASAGFLREPEALEPGVDQLRTTASALYSAPLGRDGDLSAALIWGANDLRPEADSDHHAGVQHALLAEGALRFGRQAVFGRAEYTQKSAEELALEGEAFHDEVFDVLSLSLGAGRDVFSAGGLTAMLGAQGSVYGVPEALRPLYGAAPVSLQVFLRLSPSRMAHGLAGGGHAGH